MHCQWLSNAGHELSIGEQEQGRYFSDVYRCVERTKEPKQKQTQCFPSHASCKKCIQGKTTFKNILYCQIHGLRQPVLSKKRIVLSINTHVLKLLTDDAVSWYFEWYGRKTQDKYIKHFRLKTCNAFIYSRNGSTRFLRISCHYLGTVLNGSVARCSWELLGTI